MLRHTIRASRVVLGIVLVLIGLVLSLPLVPGPGVLVMFVGVTVLSAEFEWARRLRDWMRRAASKRRCTSATKARVSQHARPFKMTQGSDQDASV